MGYVEGDKFIVEIVGINSGDYIIAERKVDGREEKVAVPEFIIDLMEPYFPRDYRNGLDDAWEAARKVSCTDVLSQEELISIFGVAHADEVLEKFSAHEVLARLKEYEENRNFEYGDEVSGATCNGIITKCTGGDGGSDECYVVWKDGSSGLNKKEDLKKTGRNFAEVFDRMMKAIY